MTPRVRPLSLAIAAAALALTVCRTAAAETTPYPPVIAWGPCSPEQVDEGAIDDFGARLECGTMKAPLDEDAPLPQLVDVGVIRVKAGNAAARQGSLFLNFGGPSGNPLIFMPMLAGAWSKTEDDGSVRGYRRRLADRYDLVAVIPRGLRGGIEFTCSEPRAIIGDPSLFRSDEDWITAIHSGIRFADSCAAGMHASVGTLGHVRDMERARVALGEPTLNFLGYSYGTWVGAFYAATYPEHAGRVVLDSSVNFRSTFEHHFEAVTNERSASFRREALLPALADPAYGLGSDPDDIIRRLRDMPLSARKAWAADIETPAQLAAALTLADWMAENPDIEPTAVIDRVTHHHFSQVPAVDEAIRDAATEYASTLQPVGSAKSSEQEEDEPSWFNEHIYFGVVCGDSAWNHDFSMVRKRAREIGETQPESHATYLAMNLVCRQWPIATQWRPPLNALSSAPPLLMAQAEFDGATPLVTAREAFTETPGAYMVMARGMRGHSIFSMTSTPCVEKTVGDYLLDGVLPKEHDIQCDYEPDLADAVNERTGEGDSLQALRERLRRILEKS
ncbi:alpha/beta hydrolase fold [Luteibacter sp. UNC138MFCol5.1]|uniref:alpha/beta hydrolase n=1 Tax=Luteibacter sp. UNC138MFCol5.1 TaxID=1502774 RepID=UPI0008BDF101|nr:alpha/beta hydrolase [Luteibacter sp. UNC138MFCol5.1]SEO32601.1 alpha/beta hydrolase fold [Luteibacter sp. UNC138MFCol5.1]